MFCGFLLKFDLVAVLIDLPDGTDNFEINDSGDWPSLLKIRLVTKQKGFPNFFSDITSDNSSQ